MKDQMLKIAKVKSEKEFYKKYPSEEAFMKAHGKAFKKAAMGSKMVNDQLHQLTDFGNPPIAQRGVGMPKQNFNKYLQGTNQPGLNPDGSIKQVGDAFNNASMAQYSGQQAATQMSAQYAPPSADQLLGKNDINSGGAAASKASGFNASAAGMAGLQGIGQVIGGIEAIGQQKTNIKKADQSAQLSGLALQAQQGVPQPQRKYVRPEDSLVQPGQLGNPYGNDTNYLQAQNGAMIGGNPTEIQNTYAPTGNIYKDLEFEPLEETYKQYKKGGRMPKAEFGEYFQDSGQAQIGSAAGGAIAAGFGLPPEVGQLVGKVFGNLAGGVKDARALQAQKDKTALSQSQMGFEQFRSQGPLNANLEHGGWVSHNWQPQVITKFGDYSVKDLLKPPHDADMLRSGGHLAQVGYTAPSAEAMFTGRPELQPLTMNTGGRLPSTNMMFDTDRYPRAQDGVQMAMGGDLEVGDGGRLETLSYNPNLPGGEIGMFRGASHDNGGIKTKYGENEVEVEGNEPVVKLQDGGSTENLVVFGNIKINKEIADLMGDPKANGKKFKTYIADVAKNDAKQLKRINKGLELIDQYDGNSSYDKLGMNSGIAGVMGGKAHQKINAERIKQAGIVQDAIHQTASELGAKSDRLAEGKIEKETDPSMVAKFGINMDIAQRGIKAPLFGRMLGIKDRPAYYNEVLQNQLMNAGMPNKDPEVIPFTKANMLAQGFKDTTDKPASSKPAAGKSSSAKGKGKSQVYVPPTAVNLTDNRQGNYEWTNPQSLSDPQTASSIEYDQSSGDLPNSPIGKLFSSDQIDTGKEKFDWKGLGQMALSNLAPWLRPSNANSDLPPDQLYPEYFALATNQLDPVQAQTYQPMLDTPYDISLNDQINAIDSQARAAIRAGGNNPAAQSMIMAQAIEAKNKVLGEQNRINQTNKMQTYSKNRDMLNDAQLKNLQILDQQYVRQAQAKSNTKEQAFSALSSIAAKTAQQRALNRKLAVLENTYNFRFSPSGRAINMNAPAQFNMSGNPFGGSTGRGLAPNRAFTYDDQQQIVGTMAIPKSKQLSMDDLDGDFKNGGKTSKTKARNSSIVKALKNL